MRLYAKCAEQRVLRSGKWHALNNEYALISKMRLITRKYSITLDGGQGIVVTF